MPKVFSVDVDYYKTGPTLLSHENAHKNPHPDVVDVQFALDPPAYESQVQLQLQALVTVVLFISAPISLAL